MTEIPSTSPGSQQPEHPQPPKHLEPERPQTPVVLAALEKDDSSTSVLDTGVRFAQMIGSKVEALHAGTSLPATLCMLARRAGVTLRRIDGPADRALVAELARPEVRAIVVGAGLERSGTHPVGPTTRYVAERSSKFVVIVPVTLKASEGPLRHLLVPLEGTQSSSRPILEALLPLLVTGAEVDVLHVFTQETLPRMLDHPVRDFELIGREFLAKHCPDASRILLRAGPVADRVREVCEKGPCDMIVLSWSQVSSAGRARVVREVLGSSAIPVLLLPAAGEAGRTALPEASSHAAP
jgi:nucleotide-binding universal stress UspA family protein